MTATKSKAGRKPFYPAMVEKAEIGVPVKFRSTKDSKAKSKAVHFYQVAKDLGYDVKMRDCDTSVVKVTITGLKHKSAKKAK